MHLVVWVFSKKCLQMIAESLLVYISQLDLKLIDAVQLGTVGDGYWSFVMRHPNGKGHFFVGPPWAAFTRP